MNSTGQWRHVIAKWCCEHNYEKGCGFDGYKLWSFLHTNKEKNVDVLSKYIDEGSITVFEFEDISTVPDEDSLDDLRKLLAKAPYTLADQILQERHESNWNSFFLDSCAVARYYCNDIGTGIIKQIVHSDHGLLISSSSGVEVISALASIVWYVPIIQALVRPILI